MTMLGVTMVVASLAVVVQLKGASLQEKDLQYAQREQALLEEKEAETKRAEELENRRIHVQTKEYVAEIAKERLGLVNPDEILIKPRQK